MPYGGKAEALTRHPPRSRGVAEALHETQPGRSGNKAGRGRAPAGPCPLGRPPPSARWIPDPSSPPKRFPPQLPQHQPNVAVQQASHFQPAMQGRRHTCHSVPVIRYPAVRATDQTKFATPFATAMRRQRCGGASKRAAAPTATDTERVQSDFCPAAAPGNPFKRPTGREDNRPPVTSQR